MSRALLPRRFSLAIPAFAISVALVSFFDVAAAQQRSDPTAVTVVGRDPNARRCNEQVVRGDVSDETISRCSDALEYRHLTQAAEIQLRINRGVTYMRRQQNEEALSDFDAVISLQPRHPEAQVNRGAALLQLHRYGPAIAAFTEALGLGVQEPYKAYFNRGAAREALGDIRGAYEDYNTALDIYPDWGPANAELQRFARQRRQTLQASQGGSTNQ
ncbi:MAG: tetratricopeptide repeat protein [Hyphomonadaceae bacterium]|nr:tetratricopeptide repeat protein [Hyphomonadaceae bacterium]